MKIIGIVLSALALVSCTGLPRNVEPVKEFDVDRYLGTWYEVARLDHRFERGLSQVTAEYALQDDGSVRVTNRGYKEETGEWSEAEGKAVFVDEEDVGHLKVSFFGPFYSSYVVFELDDEDYQYAFVTGHNRKYLWFLSRTPEVSDALKSRFLQQAENADFDTSELVWVAQ
ncbi:lipocalin family protein [Granulosicoccus sp. 3-233]|uniref:lipocalin family protein n=1 Tax=Granulosicoccus sp. 3-233 TaxID=3417969 RepID=UPI003D328925